MIFEESLAVYIVALSLEYTEVKPAFSNWALVVVN